jgi:hypothetical protein
VRHICETQLFITTSASKPPSAPAVSTAIIIAKIVASASPRARPGFHPAPATLIGFDKLAWNFFNKWPSGFWNASQNGLSY